MLQKQKKKIIYFLGSHMTESLTVIESKGKNHYGIMDGITLQSSSFHCNYLEI